MLYKKNINKKSNYRVLIVKQKPKKKRVKYFSYLLKDLVS